MVNMKRQRRVRPISTDSRPWHFSEARQLDGSNIEAGHCHNLQKSVSMEKQTLVLTSREVVVVRVSTGVCEACGAKCHGDGGAP